MLHLFNRRDVGFRRVQGSLRGSRTGFFGYRHVRCLHQLIADDGAGGLTCGLQFFAGPAGLGDLRFRGSLPGLRFRNPGIHFRRRDDGEDVAFLHMGTAIDQDLADEAGERGV